MILMQHDSNFPIAHAQHHLDMQTDDSAQALFRVLDAAHRFHHPLLGNIERVIHDVKEHLILALEVMVEATLAELEGGSHIVHGSRIVTTLLEKTSGSAQDVLTGVNGFASHARHGNGVRQRMPRGLERQALGSGFPPGCCNSSLCSKLIDRTMRSTEPLPEPRA